jgi:hypothetical protein
MSEIQVLAVGKDVIERWQFAGQNYRIHIIVQEYKVGDGTIHRGIAKVSKGFGNTQTSALIEHADAGFVERGLYRQAEGIVRQFADESGAG